MDLLGIDFSGARQAGDSIWLAWCKSDNSLRIESCRRLSELAGTADRAPALAELRGRLLDADVAGLDFSFGLPRAVHDYEEYEAFLDWFRDAFEDPDAMRAICIERAKAASGGERTFLPRRTDEPVGASSPYHWLVASQTFYGVRDVLAPLIADGPAAAVPMTGGSSPKLCEIYPAGTLRALELPSQRYKNDSDHPDAPECRERILAGLPEWVDLSPSVREAALVDSGGDALDSVLAAIAADRARRGGFEAGEAYDPVEGRIFI